MEEIKIPKKSNEKVNNWLKDQVPENKKVAQSNRLKKEAIDNKDKIEETKNQLLEKYPPDEIEPLPANRLKNNTPEANRPSSIYPKTKESFFKKNTFFPRIGEFLNRNKNKVLLGLGLISSLSASGQNKDLNKAGDQAFTNTKALHTIAKKVDSKDAIPKGYNSLGIDEQGKEYYGGKIGSKKSELLTATPGSRKGDNSSFLIEQLKKGVTAEELVEKGHATKEGIKKYAKFYTPPTLDVVYIEPGQKSKEADPYAKFAIKGEGIYLPGVGGHNAGQIYYLSMKSKNAYEAGMTNTANEPFIVRLENGNGKYIGLTVMLKSIEHRNKFFDISGRHLLPGAYEELKKLAEEQMQSNQEEQGVKKQDKDIQQLNPDFTVKTNKIGLFESEISNNK